ncbi:MAG: hypothetical protein JW844_04745 [Candidatus Omnitrophica bacterium]|nr:hypothetical protein [Candidatus Omnitrophota bacterium]
MEKRKELHNLWNRKEWKEKRDEFIKARGGKCEWCGSSLFLTVHHLDESTYDKKDQYVDLKEQENIVLCRKCHFAIHHNLELCHICRKKYHKANYLSCFNCKDKALEEERETEKEIDEAEEEMLEKIDGMNGSKEKDIVKENMARAERGEPLTVPLSQLGPKFKEEYNSRFHRRMKKTGIRG